jgi:hypothetical protein
MQVIMDGFQAAAKVAGNVAGRGPQIGETLPFRKDDALLREFAAQPADFAAQRVVRLLQPFCGACPTLPEGLA